METHTQDTDAKRRILEAAVEVIDAEGDAALRITDIASRAGVATGLINHHYGSRDGLVAAAQAVRYSGMAQDDIAMFKFLVDEQASSEQIVAAMKSMCDTISTRERAPMRLRRVSAMGASHARPELAADLSEVTTEMIDEFTRTVVFAQSRGALRNDIAPRTLATLLLSAAFGMAFADLDADPVPFEELADVVFRFARNA